LGTRFLPFSKAVSKELIPLVDKPMIHYAVEEAMLSGINKIEFVARPQQRDLPKLFVQYNHQESAFTALLICGNL